MCRVCGGGVCVWVCTRCVLSCVVSWHEHVVYAELRLVCGVWDVYVAWHMCMRCVFDMDGCMYALVTHVVVHVM